MGRKKKKPEYDSGELLNEVLNTVIEVYSKSFDREKAKGEIKAISDVLDITPIKVRKLLITANIRDGEEYYSNDKSESIRMLHEEGKTISEIMKETGLSRASVCGYLPYEKGISEYRGHKKIYCRQATFFNNPQRTYVRKIFRQNRDLVL